MADAAETDEQHLERIYGLKFPQEFYEFIKFYNDNAELRDNANVEVWPTGPFDMITDPGAVNGEHPLWDARYYDDPPEFLTFARGGCDGLHWGLYVDDPAQPPFHVAYFYSRDAFEIHTCGSTMFEFFRNQVEETHVQLKESSEDGGVDEEDYQEGLEQLARLRAAFPASKTGDRPEVGSEYLDKYCDSHERETVAPTRDEIGIVIPEEKYVALSGRDVFLSGNKPFTAEEVGAWEKEAMDLLERGYPGAALKLGKDLWIFRDYRETSYSLLDAAYTALDRPLLRNLLKDAIAYRAHCDVENEKRDAARKAQVEMLDELSG
ncbi:hypothetical protein QQS21_003807 [Conoideocrella luteorostrata]|uniref:Knr4/Smi1-like domain-containing protein n=1 Tax=Conoideocrella luteorostrata TaxID=1105319 RepID=A0AAJ0G099_9HYPO|nr:hypothetical protein QQS21_003807 [Conoideocrella luteorostrata]